MAPEPKITGTNVHINNMLYSAVKCFIQLLCSFSLIFILRHPYRYMSTININMQAIQYTYSLTSRIAYLF